MGDVGFKIANAGTAVSSTDINDYAYWSKYPGLTLMDKVSSTVTINAINYLGTQTINHSYGFAPLTNVVINHTDNGNKYTVPVKRWTSTISCPLDDLGEATEPQPAFSYVVGTSSVNIIYDVRCHTLFMGGGGPFAPTSTENFELEIYYYMWKLGSSFSV